MAIAFVAVVIILVCAGFLFIVGWKAMKTPNVPYTPWLVEMLKRWSKSDQPGTQRPPTSTDDERRT